MSDERLERCTRIFDEAANRIQAGGVDYKIIASSLMSTAISAVIKNEGEEGAAEWLREIADNLKGAGTPKH